MGKKSKRYRAALEKQPKTPLPLFEKKLNNRQFVNKAPDEVVERERQKKEDATAELKRLRTNLADLEDVA